MVLDVLINATPLRDAEGTLYGVLGIAQDISDSRCVDVDLERARVTQVCPPMNLSLCHCLFTPVFLWCLLPSAPTLSLANTFTRFFFPSRPLPFSFPLSLSLFLGPSRFKFFIKPHHIP
jgi:hypothetical protein